MPTPLMVAILTPDGQVRHRWEAGVVSETKHLLVLHGAWQRLLHTQAGEVPIQNQTLECYWPKNFYTVSAVYDQQWRLREYYARLIRPLEREGRHLRYVDLGRHLSVKPDFDVRLIEEHTPSSNGAGSDDAVESAWEALRASVEARSGPFEEGFFDAYKPA